MKRLILILIIILCFNNYVKTQDTLAYYKKLIKPEYSEIDSNFRDSIINNSWELVAVYERNFLFFRKFEKLESLYKVVFFDSTVTVIYGQNQDNTQSFTIDFEFNSIYNDLVIFNLNHDEKFAYQVLRFEDGFMVVNQFYINKKGRLKNSRKRLLFKD